MSQTKYAILGMLTIEPMSGYDLKKMSERSLVHFWQESYGNLYPRLRELETEGLIEGRVEARDGRPDATVYSITERGRTELAAWLEEPAAPERLRSELLLKIFFGAQAPVEHTVQQITIYQRQQEAVRRTYAEIEDRLRRGASTSEDGAFQLITLRRGQLLTEARLRWCEESLASLAAMQQAAGCG